MSYQYSFRNLIVWKMAKELTLHIYKVTESFPSHEQYALGSQIKRSSYSIAANIAEGNERKGKKERIRFFNIAQSSLTETDCGLEIASSVGYIKKEDYEKGIELINKTGYLLQKLKDSQRGGKSNENR